MQTPTISIDQKKLYTKVLSLLQQKKRNFMIGGTFAYTAYTDIPRKTKDIDLFTTPGEFPTILNDLKEAGYTTEIVDARWLAKARQGNAFVDIIFGSQSGIAAVDNTWLANGKRTKIFDVPVKMIAPEEFIFSKSYIQTKTGYGGPDINHIILKQGKKMDWKRLFSHMDAHWELLFAHLLNFRFVYPSERFIVPEWLINALIQRINDQLTLPLPKDKICRGTLLSHSQYEYDVRHWEFKDVS